MTIRGGLIGGGILIAVAGIAVGAIYPLAVGHFSGSQVGQYTMAQRVTEWVHPDGTTHRFSNPNTYRPVVVELDPSMNPVAFNWTATAYAGSGVRDRNASFAASLYLGRTQYFRDGFSLSVDAKQKDSKKSWGSLEQLMVQQPGKYHLVVEQNGRSGLSVNGVEIEVRRNVSSPSAALLPVGFAMAMAGAVLAVAAAFFMDDRTEQPPGA